MNESAKVLAATALLYPWSAGSIVEALDGASSGSEFVDAVLAAVVELGSGADLQSVSLHPKVRCRMSTLLELQIASSTPNDALIHAKRVKARSQARQVADGISKAKALLDEAAKAPTVEAVHLAMGEAERIALETLRQVQGQGALTLKVEAEEIAASIKEGKLAAAPRSTGVRDLDSLLSGGTRAGELMLIAARPAVGKTTLLMQVAALTAIAGGSTMVFSMEMHRSSLVERMASQLSGVPHQHIRARNMSATDKASVQRALDSIGSIPLYVDHGSIQTPASIRSAARRAAHKGVSMILVDYIQLVRCSKKDRTRAEEVGEITSELKSIAMELDIPVIAASQLSRAGDTQGEERPGLRHLRDSGCLEQDADIVVLLHRTGQQGGMYNPTVEAIVAKNRNGPTGMAKIIHQAELCRFVDFPIEV
jgi:replicative DNA helicase